MKRKALGFLAISAALALGFLLPYMYGYIRARRAFIEKYGADQIHEFLYFGSWWDPFGLALLVLAAGSAITACYYWLQHAKNCTING